MADLNLDDVDGLMYDPKDNLKSYTNKLKQLGINSKEAKKRFFSNELAQMMKKPHNNAKLSNKMNNDKPNFEHQADLLELPNDSGFKYCLVVVDVASRYREAKPLRLKTAQAVKNAIEEMYNKGPLKVPYIFKTDGGSEFKGATDAYITQQSIHQVSPKGFHLPFVEAINKELAKRLFREQQQIELDTSKVSRQWIKILPDIINDMNNEIHSSINLAPADAILMKKVKQEKDNYDKALTDKEYPVGTKVRRLLRPDEILDTATNKISIGKRRATDPHFSHNIYTIVQIVKKKKGSLVMHKIRRDSDLELLGPAYTYWRLQPIAIQTNT